MDDVDLAKFVERMKTVHAAVVEDSGATAEAHTMEPPYGAREALLSRLREDLYKDAMALDTYEIASGAVTATQIKAAYEPLNEKTDDFEYCVHDFLDEILALNGIDDNPTFTRSKIVNVSEEVQTLLMGGEYLPADYITEKIATLLGDGDKVEELLVGMEQNEYDMMGYEEEPVEEFEEEETGDEELQGMIDELNSIMEEL